MRKEDDTQAYLLQPPPTGGQQSRTSLSDIELTVADTKLFTHIHSLINDAWFSDIPGDWVIAFSGGKDSTLLLDMVLRLLVSLKPENYTRTVHVVSNDTLVESPLIVDYLYNFIDSLSAYVQEKSLPVEIKITKPEPGNTFWVNMIGRGYPPPSRMFRWCTEKLKIMPTTQYLRKQALQSGQVTILLGTRVSESNLRAQSIRKHADVSYYFGNHPELNNVKTFIPIRDLSDMQVWKYLFNNRAPWGASYSKLIRLYKEAGGGECPLVVDRSSLSEPSCGERSPRFGCWTCTLVKQDRSLDGLIQFGYDELSPYAEFREWLINFASDLENRLPISRNGGVRKRRDGTILPGPLTLHARKAILHKLQELELRVDKKLISDIELRVISDIWKADEQMYSFIGERAMRVLQEQMVSGNNEA